MNCNYKKKKDHLKLIFALLSIFLPTCLVPTIRRIFQYCSLYNIIVLTKVDAARTVFADERARG